MNNTICFQNQGQGFAKIPLSCGQRTSLGVDARNFLNVTQVPLASLHIHRRELTDHALSIPQAAGFVNALRRTKGDSHHGDTHFLKKMGVPDQLETGKLKDAAEALEGDGRDARHAGRLALERLNLEASDRAEVFDVPSQERGATEQSGCRDEGIRDRDGGAPAQLGSVPGDAGCHRHARQQVQQLTNLSLIARSQRRSGQEFTLGNDRERSAHATTLNISQELVGSWVSAQVVDEDVGVDEVLHELRRLTPEAVFPRLSKSVLEGSAWRDTATKESSRFRHNAVATQSTDAADRVNRFHRPLEGLQLVFQTFQLFYDVCRFHRLNLRVRSVA